MAVESKSGLNVAGEKVDQMLSQSALSLDPVGVDLAEKAEEPPTPELKELDNVSLAPTGSDLGQEKKEETAVVPDISHLSLKSD